jgi:hypothetical protein
MLCISIQFIWVNNGSVFQADSGSYLEGTNYAPGTYNPVATINVGAGSIFTAGGSCTILSASGVIPGFGMVGAPDFSAPPPITLTSATPEPGTLLMIGSGLAALAASGLRKLKRCGRIGNMRTQTPRLSLRLLFAGFIACLFLCAAGCEKISKLPAAPSIDPAKYYAVLLTNGAVYFGKLEGLGTPYPILRDVYYVQSSVNQETKATSNVLVKRGKELHAPDYMTINEKSIVLVEPVGANSKMMQLIEESKKQP